MSDNLTPWDDLEDGIFSFLVRDNFPGHWPHYDRITITVTCELNLARQVRFPFQAADPSWPTSGTPEFPEVVETETYEATIDEATMGWTRSPQGEELSLQDLADTEFAFYLGLDEGPGDLLSHLWHHARLGPGDPVTTTATQLSYTRDYSSTTTTDTVPHTDTADFELSFRPDEIGVVETPANEWIASLSNPRGGGDFYGINITTDLPPPLAVPGVDYATFRADLVTPPEGGPIVITQETTITTTDTDVTEGEWYGTRHLLITITLDKA